MSQLVYKKTKQIRIDSELHRLLKTSASQKGKSIKELVEKYIEDWLLVNEKGRINSRD